MNLQENIDYIDNQIDAGKFNDIEFIKLSKLINRCINEEYLSILGELPYYPEIDNVKNESYPKYDTLLVRYDTMRDGYKYMTDIEITICDKGMGYQLWLKCSVYYSYECISLDIQFTIEELTEDKIRSVIRFCLNRYKEKI